MRIKEIIALVEGAVREPALLPEVIAQLQEFVWTSAALQTPVDELLRDLAYNLDYFENNPKARKEDPSFVDEAAAIAEIKQAIARLQEVEGNETKGRD